MPDPLPPLYPQWQDAEGVYVFGSTVAQTGHRSGVAITASTVSPITYNSRPRHLTFDMSGTDVVTTHGPDDDPDGLDVQGVDRRDTVCFEHRN